MQAAVRRGRIGQWVDVKHHIQGQSTSTLQNIATERDNPSNHPSFNFTTSQWTLQFSVSAHPCWRSERSAVALLWASLSVCARDASEETRISYIDGGEIAAAAAAAVARSASATYAPLSLSPLARCSADTRDKPAITSVVTNSGALVGSEEREEGGRAASASLLHMMMMMAE